MHPPKKSTFIYLKEVEYTRNCILYKNHNRSWQSLNLKSQDLNVFSPQLSLLINNTLPYAEKSRKGINENINTKEEADEHC